MTPGDLTAGQGREPRASKTLRQLRMEHITRVLKASGFDRKEAARLLDISEEELTRLMRCLGIEDCGDCPDLG